MEFVNIVLVLSLFYASASGDDVSSGRLGELVLTHDYPLIWQDNFNFVRLTCGSEITSSSSCDGIAFLLNGTNIRETPLNVSDCTKGSIFIRLSQDSEGEFVCSYNSTLLSNNVTLAGERIWLYLRTTLPLISCCVAIIDVCLTLQLFPTQLNQLLYLKVPGDFIRYFLSQ